MPGRWPVADTHHISFELQISAVEHEGAEMAITGRIVSGAYSGPERVTVKTSGGGVLRSFVTHHSLVGVQDWPVTARHEGYITVHVAAPRESVAIDTNHPLVGVGFRWQNPNSADISSSLLDPLFWAFHLHDELETDEVVNPASTYFTVNEAALDKYYKTTIDARFHTGTWPFVRMTLRGSKYIEYEFVADVEYQNRFWIGDESRGARVLVGYQSGHFSLPAFRLAEVRAIARVAAPGFFAVLLLPGCDTTHFTADDVALIASLVAELPGMRRSLAPQAAKAILEARATPDLTWSEDLVFGWINNSPYSQRNPNGPMSIILADDFQFIGAFFNEVGGA